jgi:hypothetical protein
MGPKGEILALRIYRPKCPNMERTRLDVRVVPQADIPRDEGTGNPRVD